MDMPIYTWIPCLFASVLTIAILLLVNNEWRYKSIRWKKWCRDTEKERDDTQTKLETTEDELNEAQEALSKARKQLASLRNILDEDE